MTRSGSINNRKTDYLPLDTNHRIFGRSSIWIALHWRYLRVRGSGPRRVARQHVPLERLAHFLRHAVEAIYGVVSLVHPPNVKSVIY